MTELYLGKIALGDVPDAHAIVKIDGRKASRAADLFLHRSDMEVAQRSINYINKIPQSEMLVREALFRSAIIQLLKCFDGTGARSHLAVDKIFAGQPLGREVFQHFKELRNRTIAHDENSHMQTIPVAVLNDGSKDHKVETVMSLGVSLQILDQDSFNNLATTVKFVFDWVAAEYEKLCLELKAELETKSYAELSSMSPAQYSKPKPEDVSKRRKRV